ncbi:MAG: amino acid ABC transporter ATP-binding protein [Clostridia bacterium]|nr:amino acid ABC transporter ATP-binding protein [Clostridia bacterium]
MLNVTNLSKHFGKLQVLKDINFSMEEGQVVSIIGSSGSGKTTLLRCINMLENANGGKIYLDGKLFIDADSSVKYTPGQLRTKQLSLGLVFQDFNLFPQYNVLENVTLAPRLLAKERSDYKTRKKEILYEIEENAKSILASVGLSEKLESYPCQLSGGQKQRVSIARALALKPRILFFDEPTSALDPELTGEILKVIRQLAAEHITMIIVTHEIDFAYSVSDKVIFMDKGVIAEEGTPDEVLKNPKNPRTQAFLQKLS